MADPPEINKTASSQNVPAWPGYPVNLKCTANGNPRPKYIWSNRSGVVAMSESSDILRVVPQDGKGFGPYTCKVENSMGYDSLDITLVKVGKAVFNFVNRAVLD